MGLLGSLLGFFIPLFNFTMKRITSFLISLVFASIGFSAPANVQTSTIGGNLTAGFTVPTGVTVTTSGSGVINASTLATYTPATLPASNSTEPVFRPEAYGAKGDAVTIGASLPIYSSAITIASGSNALTVAVGSASDRVFLPSDVGQYLCLPTAGVAGAPLNTTILAYVSATQVTLADNASTAFSGTSNTLTKGTSAITIASGSPDLVVSGGTFAPSDVGKLIDIAPALGTHAGFHGTILAVVSSTQVTLSVNSPYSYNAVVSQVTYGTDDTTAIQDAVNAAGAAGGKVVLSDKTYCITSPILFDKSAGMEGGFCGVLFGPRSTYASDVVPTVTPYLSGSVILQMSPATTAISIPLIGSGVNFKKFGIRFADSFKFLSTGHGIEALPPVYSTYRDNGMDGGNWESIYVYGQDGDHYAFHFVNAQLMQLNDIQGFGGGGLWWQVDTGAGFYGNSTVINPYFLTSAGGSAHGFYLSRDVASHGCILMNFVRPQSFFLGFWGGNPTINPTNAQYNFFADDDCDWLHIEAADYETTAGSNNLCYRYPATSFGGSYKNHSIANGGDDSTVTSSSFKLTTYGSNTTTPKILGFDGISTGEAVQFHMGDSFHGFKLGFGGNLTEFAYYGLKFYGNAQGATIPYGAGYASDPAVNIIGTTASAPVLAATAASSQSANIQEWRDSSGTALSAIDPDGSFTGNAATSTALHIISYSAGTLTIQGDDGHQYQILATQL